MVLVDTTTQPATVYPLRARVDDRGEGVRVERGRIVARSASLVIRMSLETWPRDLPMPDASTSPSDRLRVVRGSIPEGLDSALAGAPVARLRRSAGAVTLEVD